MKRPEQILANFLKENKLTIAFAESITCGLAANKLGTINGTSDILSGSIVCYSEEVKIKLLGVDKNLIEKDTAESQTVTDAMALNLSKLIPADIHAATTGLAAPGGSETKSKPVGTVFYSVRFKNKLYKMNKRFYGSPLQVKEKACSELFKFITRKIKSGIYLLLLNLI
jgi:nicotinamide-nucleotide amidase